MMFHTGTSISHGARNKYGDPIYIDDVAVDFPRLKILMAHGGRPLWMDTAFFLLRRHPNVYLDISGIPPKTLLKYFPRLDEIAAKTLFGTDWPGPGVRISRKPRRSYGSPSERRHAAADPFPHGCWNLAGINPQIEARLRVNCSISFRCCG